MFEILATIGLTYSSILLALKAKLILGAVSV